MITDKWKTEYNRDRKLKNRGNKALMFSMYRYSVWSSAPVNAIPQLLLTRPWCIRLVVEQNFVTWCHLTHLTLIIILDQLPCTCTTAAYKLSCHQPNIGSKNISYFLLIKWYIGLREINQSFTVHYDFGSHHQIHTSVILLCAYLIHINYGIIV